MDSDRGGFAREKPLLLSDFSYSFPEHLVAQEPQARRDQSRLLIRSNEGLLKDSHVYDLTTQLTPGTLLIFNDTRVFASRLLGHLPSGGAIEIFLLEPIKAEGPYGSCCWLALGRPMRKLLPGVEILFANNLRGRVLSKSQDGAGNSLVTLEFNIIDTELSAWLDQNGYIPLPPYIKRPNSSPAGASADRDRYQTVYAQNAGSVAAPTAGLHFTEALLQALKDHGVETGFVSLHVGAGTFLPVKVDTIADHKMHAERYRVGSATALALTRAKAEGRPIVAVGTTTLRSLESLFRKAEGSFAQFVKMADEWRTTDLFIYPRSRTERYRPVVDGLMTNFHQPCSTLFMMVCALVGLEEAKALYATAIERQYRLYSYGDACLLWL